MSKTSRWLLSTTFLMILAACPAEQPATEPTGSAPGEQAQPADRIRQLKPLTGVKGLDTTKLKCERTEDCAAVANACGHGWMAVNAKHRVELERSIKQQNSARGCPDQPSASPAVTCFRGMCLVSEGLGAAADADSQPVDAIAKAGAQGAPASQPAAAAQKDHPKTVAEAVATLMKKMKPEDLQTIKQTPEDQLIKFHHGLGTAIRNQLGLWGGNAALMQDCGKPHPDDCSMLVIEALWRELNKNR